MTTASASSPNAAWLHAGFGAAVLGVLGVGWVAPEWVIVPGVLGCLGGIALLAPQRPLVTLTVVLGSFAFVARAVEGLQVSELVYAAMLYPYLLAWYAVRGLASPTPIVRSRTDALVATTLVLAATLGVVLGVIFGSPLSNLRQEVTGFFMLALYFPVKEGVRTSPRGAWAVAGALAFIGAYVAIQNYYGYYQIIRAATESWQIADGRPGYNALPLMVVSLGSLALLPAGHALRHRLGLAALFALCFGALIVIKYRGFWVGFALGFVALTLILSWAERRRFLIVLAVVVSGGFALLMTVAGPALILFLEGFVRRLTSLQTAGSRDVSLLNRFWETRELWDHWIRHNPVLGYGFGAEYHYFSWITRRTFQTGHVHIGYTGLWFKLGLWGVALVFSAFISAAFDAYRAYRTSHGVNRLLAATVVACLIAPLATIMTENPFFMQDQMFTLTLVAGLGVGLAQRSREHVG